MERTTLGNSPFHEAIVAELYALRSSVRLLIEDLQAEPEEALTTAETWLAADAQALGYLTEHFLSVFEGSICGLDQLREQAGQERPAGGADRDDVGVIDAQTHDDAPRHNSCCDDQSPIVVKLCPWSVSSN